MKPRQQQLEYLKTLQDEDIDLSDAAEVKNFISWEPNPFFRQLKVQISAKIDKDLMAWLKMHGEVSKFLNRIISAKMFEERQKVSAS